MHTLELVDVSRAHDALSIKSWSVSHECKGGDKHGERYLHYLPHARRPMPERVSAYCRCGVDERQRPIRDGRPRWYGEMVGGRSQQSGVHTSGERPNCACTCTKLWQPQ